MYKCLECGHLFEYGEEAVWVENHGLDSPPYERWSGCPACRGDYKDAFLCRMCGSYHVESNLYNGICSGCLKNSIDHTTALEFMTSTDVLCNFMFEKVWDSSQPEKISEKFKKFLREVFLRKTADDLLCNKTEFLNICIEFILEDDGEYGKDAFSSWLINNSKGVK